MNTQPLTKTETKLLHLLRTQPHSAKQLRAKLQCKAIARRVKDLRNRGYVILTLAVDNPSPYARNPLTFYFLAGSYTT